MAVTVAGDGQYEWALQGSSVSVDGMKIETVTLRSRLQVDETAMDDEGLVAAHAYGGEEFEISASGYAVGTVPKAGDPISVLSKSGVITEVEEALSNRDFKKLSVTAKGFDGISY